MRLIINLVLLALAAGLCYVLFNSISDPINFQTERAKREDAVVNRLMNIRKAQEIYRDVTGGSFAKDFATLADVVKNGKIPVIKVIGDPDDPTNTAGISYDTTFNIAADVYNDYRANTSYPTVSIDSLLHLDKVPYSDSKFSIFADTLTYQSTLVNVVEVGVKTADFMGQYASNKFKSYDARYDPNKILKFGDKNKPNLSGNWER